MGRRGQRWEGEDGGDSDGKERTEGTVMGRRGGRGQ